MEKIIQKITAGSKGGSEKASRRGSEQPSETPSETDITQNSDVRPQISETQNSDPSVLRAHEAFRKISTKKPTQHELMQINQLTFDYPIEQILTAINIMGDKGWHSIASLKKELKGEMKDKRSTKKEVVMQNPKPQTGVYYCRSCDVSYNATQSRDKKGACPQCGKEGEL